MSIKKSVMITDQAEKIMLANTRDDGPIAWSQQVNRALIVNDWLFRQCLPELSAEEWQTVLNAYAGTTGSLEVPPYRVASDLMDDLGLIDVADHPMPELVKRLHAMDQAQQFAVLQFVERFWARDWNNAGSFGEIVEQIKAGD